MSSSNNTTNLNSYGGRNKWSVPIGTTRNTKGSSNRIYQYCSRVTETPLYCMFQLPKDYIIGFLIFSFVYTGLGTITENILKQLLPIQSIPGIFEFRPYVTIVGNNVYAKIETFLRKLPSYSYPSNLGFTFAAPSDISSLPPVKFFNDYTTNLTFISASNLPFSKLGSQFANLFNKFNISPNFLPYFLPGTSLNSCFENCTNFNSNISSWDTSNVTNMDSTFSNANSFNQPIGDWDTSNVTNMDSTFSEAISFNQSISLWNTSNVTTMDNMFQGVDMNNPDSATNQDNYNALLNSWADDPKLQNNVVFDAGLSKYTISVAGTARSYLTTSTASGGKGWQITDGGGVSPPSAPTITSITPIDNEITINFSVPINDGGLPITDYKYSLNGGAFISAETSTSPITVTGLSYNTTYEVIIRAVNSVGDGQISNMESITISPVAPSAPTITSITPRSSEITINFSVPTNNGGAAITDYKYSLNGGAFIAAGTTTSPITVTGLSYNTTYEVIIRAVNSVGDGQISNMESITISPVAPSAPTITSITPRSSEITINFSVPTNNGGAAITDYKYSLNGGAFIAAGKTTSPIIVKGLSYNTSYQVIIRAVNSVGDGTISNMISVTTTGIGSLNYSFNYTGTGLTEQLVLDNRPIITLAGKFTITSTNITIVTTNVNVEIVTYLYEGPYSTDFGMTFNFNSLATFYRTKTSNLTLTSSNNCPFSRAGNQFNGLQQSFNISSTFQPYFLPQTSLNFCFGDCQLFNSNISNWDTSNVTTMSYMFAFANIYNQQISSWDTSNVTDMSYMFRAAKAFNNGDTTNIGTKPLTLNTSQVTIMEYMFSSAEKFNQRIDSWDTSKVTNTSYMFNGAMLFNNGEVTNTGSIPLNWNTSSLINMGNMFAIGSFQPSMAFNQPINTSGPYWNTSNVTQMFGVFVGPSLFNQPIDNWNTSKVTTMSSMFKDATSFNRPLGSWDTSKVTDMNSIFRGATQFKQDISNWTPYACTNMTNMFLNVDMNSPNSATNQTNYNALLTSWGNNPRLPLLKNSVPFHAGTSKYTISVAGTARSNLTTATGSGGKGWAITDGGGV